MERIVRDLDADLSPEDAALFRPRYNVAPSDLHWIVEARGDDRVILPATWGYQVTKRSLINVRSEQIASRTGFRDAFESRRCLMVTDGFLEWDDRRAPYWLHRQDRGLVLLGGLYQPPQAGARPRFTVLTSGPNTVVSRIHSRMPVIIPTARVDEWLFAPSTVAARFLTPAPDDLIATPVSRRVNSVRNDDPACLAPPDADPVPAASRQTSLF